VRASASRRTRFRANLSLSDLAANGRVNESPRNQAFFALPFLQQQVLQGTLQQIQGAVRSNRTRWLTVVISREEVRLACSSPGGVPRLACRMVCEAGLRPFEGLSLG
jgi:hypothetical protein